MKLSATPGAIGRLPPVPGADTDAVLDAAGLAPDDIATLRRDGIV